MNNIPVQAVVHTYRRYAPYYDRMFGNVLGHGRMRMAQIVAHYSPDVILEIGVGTGLTLPNYPASSRLIGIDLSPDMLKHARNVALQLPERQITLHQMDAERLAFADNSFDCVTIPYVMSVTPDPDQLVREARRVCKPEGHIVIVNHFSGGKIWWMFERLVQSVADRIGFRSAFDFNRHILSHDWRVTSVEPVNLFGLSRLVVVRNV
jgi:phosphatidylethanolamine/phosphatidyl-N-methylethanolamine N-methyltransferase